MEKNKKYHLIYLTICKINNFYYFGKHSTNNVNDKYIGSGKELNRHIKKYGKNNFKKMIIARFNDEKEAYVCEKLIIENFILDNKCYNIKSGGEGGKEGHTVYITKEGKKVLLHKDDQLVKNKEVVGHNKGIKNIKISKSLEGTAVYILNGNKMKLKTNDPRVLNGEAVGINKGKSTYILNGEKITLNTNDLRVLNGEAVRINKGRKNKITKIKIGSWNKVIFTKEEENFIIEKAQSITSPKKIMIEFNKYFNKKIKFGPIYRILRNKKNDN